MQETQVWSLGRERSPGEGNGYPLQCSCLENPMDRGAWWARVNGVTKSQTRLPRKENSLSSEQWNIERVCITSQSMLKGKPISFSQFLFFLSESGPGVTILVCLRGWWSSTVSKNMGYWELILNMDERKINLYVLNPLYIIKYTIQELREVVRERLMNLELICLKMISKA